MTRRKWAAETCTEEGCASPSLARNLCSKHYQRRKYRGETLPPIVRVKYAARQTCRLETCDSLVHSFGLCSSHAQRFRRYGLTDEQLLEFDRGACEVCGSRERLHVDHDHETGAVRGLLCGACNTALGLLGDDCDRISRLASYLIERG